MVGVGASGFHGLMVQVLSLIERGAMRSSRREFFAGGAQICQLASIGTWESIRSDSLASREGCRMAKGCMWSVLLLAVKDVLSLR